MINREINTDRLAKLSMLTIDKQEILQTEDQLLQLLNMADILSSSQNNDTGVTDLQKVNRMRDDVAAKSQSPIDVSSLTKNTKEGYITVPNLFEDKNKK